MNDKDNQEFNEWWENDCYEYDSDQLITQKDALYIWGKTCEYKQKEIDELIKQLKHEHDLYKKHLKVYEAENAKLRECVEEISKMRREVGFYVEPTYPAMICIQVLKELNNNQLNNTK